MRVLVIGSGGREHTICHCIAESPLLDELFILPGNAGTAALGTNVPLDPMDIPAVVDFAKTEKIDLTIVGPEAPLTAGIVDKFDEAGLRIFGPNAKAAQLEGDKVFAKQLMRQHAIPTAEARVFNDFTRAKEFIATRDEALVVKAAGLCAGKGVIICDDPSDGIIAAEQMLVEHSFGEAGKQIIVEEKLAGREASVLAIVDGRSAYILEPAQDHKRLLDNDEGPNTGGMGAYCPTPAITEDIMQQVEEQIIVPTLDALIRQNINYRGVLYTGLMLTLAGPKVLEFNCRFGDPETQVVLPRIKSDLLELFDLATRGKLDEAKIDWDDRHALCVVMASGGYPGKYEKGKAITGLPENTDDLMVFHAGTKTVGGNIVTSGGRVLGVTALGETVGDARTKAYAAAETIRFEGAQYRKDLGEKI